MNIEDAICSKLRLKIFRILNQIGELNVSELARRLHANYETTSQHLRILEEEDLLKHQMYGRIRLYRVNEGSPRAKALQELLEIWEHTNRQ